MITREQLTADLTSLGLKPGDAVMVHSSLSALGPVAGGADTVVDALLEAIGPVLLDATDRFEDQHVAGGADRVDVLGGRPAR